MKKLLISLIVAVFLVGAISQVADAAEFKFHQKLKYGGTVTIYGTKNCHPVGDPLWSGRLDTCQTITGAIPDTCNDFLAINVWDPRHGCTNTSYTKWAVKYYEDGKWKLEWVGYWTQDNVPDSLLLPGLGDSTGTTPLVHTIGDLAEWLADPRPLQDTYDIVDGECPDLPGYLIGTTPIVFDSLAPPDENPFQTTPLTGRLWLSGSMTFTPTEDIPTLTEWGLIILALLLLTAGTIAVVRRRKAVAARAS